MARWLKTCELVRVTNECDEYGVAHEREVRRTVRCNPFSMGAQTYYAAMNSGVQPIATLQLYKCDYEGERTIVYDGAKLSVVRIDGSSPDFVTLTLAEKLGDHG